VARSEGLEPPTFWSVATGKRTLISCSSRSPIPARPPASTCMRQGCCTQLLYCWPKGKIGRALPVKRGRGGEAHRRGPTRCALR